MFICSRFHSSLTSSSSFADFMPLSFSSCSTHLPLLRQFFTFFPLPLPPPPLSFSSLAFLSFFQLSSSCSFTRFLFSRFLFFLHSTSTSPPPPSPPGEFLSTLGNGGRIGLAGCNYRTFQGDGGCEREGGERRRREREEKGGGGRGRDKV